MPPPTVTMTRLILLLSILLASCAEPSPEDVCNRMGECPGVTADTVAKCKQGAEQWSQEAIEAGCDAELDAYLSCFEHVELCTNPPPTDACRAEAEAMSACTIAGS